MGTRAAVGVGRIVVIGGGRMGSGIAHAFLATGHEVTMVEGSAELGERARMTVSDLVRTSEEHAALAEPGADVIARLTVATEVPKGAGTAVVVEAVPERLELKRDVLVRAEEAVGDDTLLATNTSSLSIDSIADGIRHPARLVGMHFFNPVPVSTMVEVVRGPRSSRLAVDEALAWTDAIGKTAIEVADSPGFASSRLGLVLGLEAIRMLEEGVASAEDIDTAMTLGYKHPIGPLKLTDLVGLDVRLDIATYLESTLGPAFRPPRLLRTMVIEGRLGKKTGQGFYDW